MDRSGRTHVEQPPSAGCVWIVLIADYVNWAEARASVRPSIVNRIRFTENLPQTLTTPRNYSGEGWIPSPGQLTGADKWSLLYYSFC